MSQILEDDFEEFARQGVTNHLKNDFKSRYKTGNGLEAMPLKIR